MYEELGLLVQNIPRDDVDRFIKNTKSIIDAKDIKNKRSYDYSWIDVVEETIPSLDSIIRNPRRFIVSEEDVVRIEKTKKVTLESIKDLAQHTNYIQEVDEDGFVKPIKLLNIFKEETIDLYENRFVYTLIVKLRRFVEEQLTYKEQSVESKDSKVLNYEATTSYLNKNVSVNLTMTTTDNIEENTTEEVQKEREEKIKNIQEVIEDFNASKFMIMMNNATEVRSPIRKTNMILKDYNFNKALALWEYLENYQVNDPKAEENNETNLYTNSMQQNLDLTNFINYCILNNIVTAEGKARLFESDDIVESMFEYAKKFDVDEKKLRKELESKINLAVSYKNEQKASARKAYKQFIENHDARYKKANNLFK